MARYDDSSPHCDRWTNHKLISELNRTAHLETFSPSGICRTPVTIITGDDAQAFILEETRLYRQSWLAPIIEEIERRMVKP